MSPFLLRHIRRFLGHPLDSFARITPYVFEPEREENARKYLGRPGEGLERVMRQVDEDEIKIYERFKGVDEVLG